MMALSALWWAGVIVAASQGIVVPWSLPPAVAHSVLMTFGFMPLFFTGFLFTAGPKWLRQPAVPARRLLAPILAQLSGWAAFVVACHARSASLAVAFGALGLGVVAAGWLASTARFALSVRRSEVPDRVHSVLVACGCLVGVAGLSGASVGVASGDLALVRACVHGSLWGFVGLVFATVSHRMGPYFSAAAVPVLDAWCPLWLLWTFVGVFVLQAAASMADAYGLGEATSWRVARGVIETLAGTGILVLAIRRGLAKSLRIRLLAMLHVGFTWLGVSLLMAGISRLADLGGVTMTPAGLAATHAYTMGFLGSTMFTMVSRVSTGHSGRVVAADDFLWRLFWMLQLAVLARLAGAVLVDSHPGVGEACILAAAMGWAGVCVAWGLRYGSWFGRPRPDGRPG